MTSHNYTAHGLVITSEIEISEYSVSKGAFEQPDVSITHGHVATEGLSNPNWQRQLTQVNPNAVWMDVPGVARFLITDGAKITVDAYPEADNADLCAFLVGSCIGAILHQKGFLVLHASAVVYRDKLIVICGESGAGKSTTASIFAQQGAHVFTDDILVIDQNGQAWPGSGSLRLWKNALKALGKDSEGHKQIRRELPKFSVPAENPWPSSDARPVDAIAILEANSFVEFQECLSEPITGMQKFKELREQSFRRDAVSAMGHGRKHLQQSAQFLATLPMFRVKRPTSKFSGQDVFENITDQVFRKTEPADGAR